MAASRFPRPGYGSMVGSNLVEPDGRERLRLPIAHAAEREILDCLVEQHVKIELRAQVQKHGPEPDRGAVHEHEFARDGDRPLLLERLMHPERFAPAVFGGLDAVGQAAHPIVQQRSVDEPSPDIEHVDQFAAEPLEAPRLVSMDDESGVVLEQAMVKIDDAADELRREDANAAVIEQIDAGGHTVDVEHAVIAEMRIAVDHAETAE